MKPRITWDKGCTKWVLLALGYGVDEDGYICRDYKRILATDGKEIRESELAGFTKGNDSGPKMKIWRNDICSLIEMSDEL